MQLHRTSLYVYPHPSQVHFPGTAYTLVLRLQAYLKIPNVDWGEISVVWLNLFDFTWRQANLEVRFDATQNTTTISTPFENGEKAPTQVKQSKLGNINHSVQVFGLASDDSVKRLIRGVPVRFF
ncbi:hypothetical protein HPB48_014578 [Haemaphysalis longicornis]|uniref:Uncharacterized protein n=1 Tax=Haemaphysalis longicornis TaxID=44386 RepID=A0A9J6GA16_HAELO|nr:hypothetical protein HPB48_014578 [Haemaphysalis longicornis]